MHTTFFENPSIESIQSTALKDFYRRWLALSQEPFPPRNEIFSIADFGEHIPFMAINDYNKSNNRFHVRFFGSGYVDGCGQDFTNRYVDEIDNTDELMGRYMWSVQNKMPYLSLANRLDWSPNDFKSYDILACPLFDEVEDVSALLFRIEFSKS